jgi:phosphatidate phosphatase APP1
MVCTKKDGGIGYMKDGFDFEINPTCDDWGNIDEYEAFLKDKQIDGHVVRVQSEGVYMQDAVAGIIVYLDTRIKELTDIKDTLKGIITKEDKE